MERRGEREGGGGEGDREKERERNREGDSLRERAKIIACYFDRVLFTKEEIRGEAVKEKGN